MSDALRSQLEQLNERSRWYSTQLWQLPMAYLGLAGIGVAGVIEKAPDKLPWLLLVVSFVGYAILFHTFGLNGGIRRAVREIRKVEAKLQLDKTAQYHPFYTFPLQAIVLGVAVAATVEPLRHLPKPGAIAVAFLTVVVFIVTVVLFIKSLPNEKDKKAPMDTTTLEEKLNQWIQAEETVRRRLANERGLSCEALDIQTAVQVKRNIEDPVALLDEEWTPEKLYAEVADIDFAAWLDYEIVALTESVLPLDVPRRLDEEELKFRGEIWRIHRYDPDPFPFLPHAHNLYEGLKLDLRNGKLYSRRKEVGRLPRKELLRFRGRIKRIVLPDLEV